MAKTQYLTLKATCHICGIANSRGLSEIYHNRGCTGCRALLSNDAWLFPDGVNLADAKMTIICPNCGNEFKGEIWKTLCGSCFTRKKREI